MVAWKAVSKTATWGTSGSTRRASPIPFSAGTLCSGASSESPSSARSTSSSISTGSRKRAPPCTTRWATAAESAASASDATGEEDSSSSTTESFRLVEPALTTRIFSPARSSGDLGIVLAVLARVRTRAQARVDHLLAQRRRGVAERRDAVDHVDHEVEAVEVVQHHHVERRRRRALLLVAAHVQVGVVRAPVGEPVDQPRVAVVGEDDRLVGGEERVELARRTGRAGARSPAGGASGRRR